MVLVLVVSFLRFHSMIPIRCFPFDAFDGDHTAVAPESIAPTRRTNKANCSCRTIRLSWHKSLGARVSRSASGRRLMPQP